MILILGQARTGTSVTAGIVSRLGFRLGELFEPADHWNLKGNFVDADVSRLNHYLYQGERLIGGRYAPDNDSMWSVWRDMISKRQAIKDHALLPMLDRLMAFIKIEELKVIYTHRPTEESVESLTARRGDHNRTASIHFQADCQTLIDGFLAKYRPTTLNLEFAEAFENPREYIRKIADFLGVAPNDEAVDFIAPELRRFR